MGKAGTVLPAKGVKITLDKPRTIRYTMRSLAWLADKYGSVVDAVSVFERLEGTGTFDYKALMAIADIVAAGLMHDDPDITPEFVCDNFDLDEIIKIIPALTKAFVDSMPKAEGRTPQKA